MFDNVRSWLGGSPNPATGFVSTRFEEPAVSLAPARLAPARRETPALRWSPARIAVVESLWGEGFLFPGGEEETLRLANPLGLSTAASLLLLGAGSGGPVRSIASRLGVWVTGFESDPDLASLAIERSTCSGLGRRAQIEMWCPGRPSFRPAYYHHALVLEPLRGSAPEPVLAAVAEALRPNGQIVLVDMVTGRDTDPDDPMLAAWARLERRPGDLHSETTVTRTLSRLGFDVRVREDLSSRHASLVLRGWQRAVRRISEERPPLAEAALLIAEAELWLLRLRLLRTGHLRVVRWHAMASSG